MSSLIVVLPAPGSPASADYVYALTPDGQSLADHGTAPANLLPDATELVAVVPARMVSWHRPTVPKAPANRLSEVLQGTLEENLLDDPETLHLALEPGARSALGSGEPIWVAACDKEWLREVLQGLEAVDLRVTRIVPEVVPGLDQWWVHGTPQSAWCAQSDALGVAVLPLAAVQSATVPPVFAEPAVAALAEQTFGVKVTIRQMAQQLVLAAQTDWNLAQFDLATAGRKGTSQRLLHGWQLFVLAPQWRALRWGLVALFVVQLFAINGLAWNEKSALNAKRAEVRKIYLDTFPQAQVVLDPAAQMTRDVSALQQAVGQVTYRDLEVMLSYAAAVLPGERKPTALEFKPGEVKLKGISITPDELKSMDTRLGEAGYHMSSQADGLVISFNPTKARL